MSINIQRNQKKRVVIVGGGLGGVRLAEDLYGKGMQLSLIHISEPTRLVHSSRMPSSA